MSVIDFTGLLEISSIDLEAVEVLVVLAIGVVDDERNFKCCWGCMSLICLDCIRESIRAAV